MKISWKPQDLIDLEYLLQEDEKEGGASDSDAVAVRDRDIFLQRIQPVVEQREKYDDTYRRIALRLWLEARREKIRNRDSAPLPGDIYREVTLLLRVCSILGGLMTGSAAAAMLLRYTGREPVNIWNYFGTFVFLQILLLTVLLFVLLLRRFIRFPRSAPVLQRWIGGMMGRVMQNIRRRSVGKARRADRDRFQSISGLLRGKQRIYGNIFYWPVFLLVQVFAASFNIGVLGASLLRIIGTDLAFGWQSTLQFSAEGVYRLVQIIALPWSWFLPAGIAYPSLSRIEGSRMVLKEGIMPLATPDMVAWWPFLLLGVLFYGLIPRLALIGTSVWMQRRKLSRLHFYHAACLRLLRRLETPWVRTEAALITVVSAEGGRAPIESAAIVPNTGPRDRVLFALVPQDLFRSVPAEALTDWVMAHTRRQPREIVPIHQDADADRTAITSRIETAAEKAYQIIVIQEAWQPPILETVLFFKELRAMLEKDSMIEILLVGRPDPTTALTPADRGDREIWHRAVNAIGDPFIGVAEARRDHAT